MNFTISYKRTMQIREFEPVTIEATISDIPLLGKEDIQETLSEYTIELETIVERLIAKATGRDQLQPINKPADKFESIF